jgi:hypothetical protein
MAAGGHLQDRAKRPEESREGGGGTLSTVVSLSIMAAGGHLQDHAKRAEELRRGASGTLSHR